MSSFLLNLKELILARNTVNVKNVVKLIVIIVQFNHMEEFILEKNLMNVNNVVNIRDLQNHSKPSKNSCWRETLKM